MKKLKKVFAVLLSVAMILGMSTTVFAAEPTTPTNSSSPNGYPSIDDRATVQVGGLKEGDVVSFYQVVEPEYKQHGVKGYKTIEVANEVVSDVKTPSSESITNIANAILTSNPAIAPAGIATANGDGLATSDLLKIGMYVALVTPGSGNVDTAYNPMVVSSFYTKDGIRTEVVSADENFDLGTEPAYAKHTKVDIDKQIVEPGSGNVKGDDTAIGDDTTFKITTKFPAYSNAYKNVEFNIIDTLSKGLTAKPETITIKAGDKDLTKDTDYTVDSVKDNTTGETTMTIRFVSKCILDNRGADVEVRYAATLNNDAGINFDKNTNTVKAEYSNHPTNDTKATTDEKETYHYTFAIDANIYGSSSEEWNQLTTELYKVGSNTTEESGTIENPYAALDGAKFELRKVKDDKADMSEAGLVGSAESGKVKYYNTETGQWENEKAVPGALQFWGLDAGEYRLIEVEPPAGYQLNDTEVPVVIDAHYNTDGTLKDYSITIDGKHTTKYEAEYTADKVLKQLPTITKDLKSYIKDENGNLINIITGEATDKNGNPIVVDGATYAFINTDLASLPSTGGIGTIIFTVGGCLIMVVAAALYFANRRRSANSESK